MNEQQKVRSITMLVFFWLFLLLCTSAEAEIHCYDCHGTRVSEDNRPVDASDRDISTGGFPGNHQTHLPIKPGQESCAACHPGSELITTANHDGKIKVSAHINASPKATAYKNRTSVSIFQQNPAPPPDMSFWKCTNVNCHFENITPNWGSTKFDPRDLTKCNKCHENPPEYGAHRKKHRDYYGSSTSSCSLCHTDHTKETNPFAHALSAGKRPLNIQFTSHHNRGGSYNGTVSYPAYLPSQGPSRNGSCTDLYCHSNARGSAPVVPVKWSDTTTTTCFSCHRGQTKDNTHANCNVVGGTWDSSNSICSVYLTMTSYGHGRLVGPQWIRKYPCSYCHYDTVTAITDSNGKIIGDGVIRFNNYSSRHVNGSKDVVMAPQWSIVGRPDASYDPDTKTCYNVYCHSDGTTTPPDVRPFGWKQGKTECNTCHGHVNGACNTDQCHDGKIHSSGILWPIKTGWKSGEEWKAAIPMFKNEGAGTARANSHARHTETTFTCDQCHASTIANDTCTDCHVVGIPSGKMSEFAHLDAAYHANKSKDVKFKGNNGSYNSVKKICSNSSCHPTDTVWGGSVNEVVVCVSCHGTSQGDVDTFGFFQPGGERTKINMTEWETAGHGRYSTSGRYPQSGNPAANFPKNNPCWYCHDNNVLHKEAGNPFRLRMHPQFSKRFDKECGYCHMEGKDSECLGCHNAPESLALQMTNPAVQAKHGNVTVTSGCRVANCHDTDARLHKSGSPFWTPAQNADVKNQYMMMGVCLQCHDDDSSGGCTSCHTGAKYSLGFSPGMEGTPFIKPKKARASTVHFGYKHYKGYQQNNIWKGGKFCWDCHDPHGDKNINGTYNIFMIQSKVATETDGTFGIPTKRADVVFTRKQSGADYVKTTSPYNGICNVCHTTGSQHFRSDGGDGHNISRVCTKCHEHKFGDSHADEKPCNTCHQNKPVPRHSGFGLPKDCTKCHEGTINKRMDVMGQFGGTSHHVQGVAVTNKQCYACHWESTPDGLIDERYHEGYNFKAYSTVKNAKVDLVIYGAGIRPTRYSNRTTAIQFLASNIGTGQERAESAKVSTHCISCHNDQNNNSQPFTDCKTPRQYAWDRQSIESRFSSKATTAWGKYGTNGKNGVTKALSAHGNAVANQGGWTSPDSAITNTRKATTNVECFDCHSSHGSKLVGVTSSYVTFNGTKNGGNLKETQAGIGGYNMSYKATSNLTAEASNPYNAGAGQCFDCHLTKTAGKTPWGYKTFGQMTSIKGYFDSYKFGTGVNGSDTTYPYKTTTTKFGHMKASSPLTTSATGTIEGLCTPCHDPHGVSQTLVTAAKQNYAVPLLKGTWMTSPSKEDAANPNTGRVAGGYGNNAHIDNINETDDKFAGLCLRCHLKGTLTDGTNKNTAWKSIDRVHESVNGWSTTSNHKYACSKCHTPHVTSLPRLMVTNCLDYKHRGRVTSNPNSPQDSGYCENEYSEGDGRGCQSGSGSFPTGSDGVNCHPGGAWPDNYWNNVTPWPKPLP